MTKELIKVSYLPITNPDDGSVHRKGFTISERVYSNFIDCLYAETALEKDYYRKLYLSAQTIRRLNIVFINLTQADYFIKWALKNANLKLNEKRANYDANAYLIIK